MRSHFNDSSALISEPLTNFKNLGGSDNDSKLDKHARSSDHISAVRKAKMFLETYNDPTKSIAGHIFKANEKDSQGFKMAIESIFKCIVWLAKQGLALRGHRLNMDSDELNSGNFCELVKFVAEFIPELDNHLLNGPLNARYLSPKVQNIVIESVSNLIQRKIIGEVSESGPYTLMFDETTDRNTVEQIGFILRYT